MIYARGEKQYFDDLAKSLGDKTWAWDSVFKYYRKSEKANNLIKIKPECHNPNGKLSVSTPYLTPLTDAFIETGKDMGYDEIDYNCGYPFGFSTIQATTEYGRRSDTGRAFFDEAEKRSNLKLLINTYVTKILMNKGRRALGVEYINSNGEKCRAKARREVILSAGGRNSPKLLMLSGIGPKAELDRCKIHPVWISPEVGRNIYDHLMYMGLLVTVNDSALTASDLVNPDNWDEYNSKPRTGPYTGIGSVGGIGYIKTNVSDEPGDYPDIEFLQTAGYFTTDMGTCFAGSWGVNRTIYEEFMKPYELVPTMSVIPILLHPESKGYMKLSSCNPCDVPKFYGNYFTDTKRKDIKTMIEGIRFARKMIESEPFQRHNAQLSPIKVPGCKHLSDSDDDYWECAIRTLSTSIEHQVGSCRMGKSGARSVVDSKGQVFGVHALRVADISIYPKLPGAHTYASAILCGEIISDSIKERYIPGYVGLG